MFKQIKASLAKPLYIKQKMTKTKKQYSQTLLANPNI